jgi:hypothetical protein
MPIAALLRGLINPALSASLVSLPRARSREPFNPTRDFA